MTLFCAAVEVRAVVLIVTLIYKTSCCVDTVWTALLQYHKVSQGSIHSSERGRPVKMLCSPCWDARLENIGSPLLNNYIRAVEERQQEGGASPPSSVSPLRSGAVWDGRRSVLPPVPLVADRRGILAALWFYLPACLCTRRLLQGEMSVSTGRL